VIPVVVPSHGRPNQVHAVTCVSPERLTICVPASQEAAYKESYRDIKVLAHPDTVRGLSAKRQWILEEFGSVVMIDDDIAHFGSLEFRPGERQWVLSPDEGAMLIDRLADEAAELGVFLFGINESADPRFFWESDPYRMTGWVNGGFMGILEGSKLAFNSKIVACDDYWVSALNAHYHRKVLVDRRYCMLEGKGGGTTTRVGGQAALRSAETEAEDNRILREFFGDAIGGKAGAGPALHDNQRSLRIPWA